MKYKAFLKNDKVKIFNASSECSLHMAFSTPVPTQTCPVDTGGDFNLSNGDVLHINERYGPVDILGDEVYGIGITLESGHKTFSYLLSPANDKSQESGYGTFYDLGWEYEDGNILKVYDAMNVDYSDLDGRYTEDQVSACGGSLIAILVINVNNWELVEHSMYVGNTVRLRSGEEIFISGLSSVASTSNGEIGVYFTRSTGRGCFGFYNRDDETIQETSYFYFGAGCNCQDGDIIAIYDFGDDDYQAAIGGSNNYTEENISEYLNIFCILKYYESTATWVIEEDHS